MDYRPPARYLEISYAGRSSIMTNVMETPVTKVPFVARWVESVASPAGSTSMSNPDTSTYNKSTEDSDT